jgi:hypothetical protein
MISSEVQRTLVKSPPELWAELSDPEALTRHLGALGAIRITRAEPEKLVEWEAEGTSGVVQIKSSGWGTKVTLSVTRQVELAEQPDVEDSAVAPPEPEAGPDATVEAVAEDAPDTQIEAASESSTEPVQEPEVQAIEQRRGFFARLFGRRRPRDTQEEPKTPQNGTPEPNAESEPKGSPSSSAIELLQARFAPTEPSATAEPEPAAAEVLAAKPVDLAAELKEAEVLAADEDTAVLTAALDRLGAAHHRPFSRS